MRGVTLIPETEEIIRLAKICFELLMQLEEEEDELR
jgi:hypothetical protein